VNAVEIGGEMFWKIPQSACGIESQKARTTAVRAFLCHSSD
jgi:hypothetical protein